MFFNKGFQIRVIIHSRIIARHHVGDPEIAQTPGDYLRIAFGRRNQPEPANESHPQTANTRPTEEPPVTLPTRGHIFDKDTPRSEKSF